MADGSKVRPGVFRPAVPADSHQVVWLFAIAARAACAKPDCIDDITRTLVAATSALVPPEQLAAQECARLWSLFVRVARRPKESLRLEAGRALYRDLDSIGQRLDLPPLVHWDELPAGLEDANPVRVDGTGSDEGTSVEEIRARARAKAKKKGGGPPLSAQEVLRLLSSLGGGSRERLFTETIGAGAIGRNDANLVLRFIAQSAREGRRLGRDDDTLVAVLETLGRWLVQE